MSGFMACTNCGKDIDAGHCACLGVQLTPEQAEAIRFCGLYATVAASANFADDDKLKGMAKEVLVWYEQAVRPKLSDEGAS